MTIQCRQCKQPKNVSCTAKQYMDWKYCGMLIQQAMSNVPSNERELLISGTCGKCFDKMFHTAKGA